jgi:predicted lipoprotein with Yx(FWY)xxD motif
MSTLAALPTAGAMAASPIRVLTAAANQRLGETIAVDTHGRTLYALSPETAHHLLCRSRACLQLWIPLTVSSGKASPRAGSGVQGHLGLLRRQNGKWQVTLRGMPLYRFSGDSAKGQANGQGIMSFGGTWHAVTSEAHPSSAPSGQTSPTPSEPAPPPPSYPY